MDPATVLGVAAAIVQFVEIGLKTLALCKQIRDSDTDATLLHAELQQTTKQLEIIQSLVTLDSFPRDTSRSIKQCSQECSSTAKELQDLLSEIRAIAQKKRFGVARAAFSAMKDQKKVEKIQNKLEKCQARFQTAVSVDTREQVLALLKTQGHLSQTLEDVVYPELKRMHDSTHAQISTAQKSSAAAHDTTHKALASLKKTSRASRRAILNVGTQVQGRLDHMQTSHAQRAFLKSLEHPDMFARHSQIHAPATGTFEWIFMRGSSRNIQDPRTMELQGRFSKWLRSSQPVFWINGKAGSGKSSLMSFIESHERTHDLLKIWASGHRLHVFSFFFWRAGSEMQKSISGVLQSLLYQLARAKPKIIGSLMSSEISTLERTWTQIWLQRAIEKALSYFREDRIFILIDGLDEFEGKYTALTTLILGLQNGSHLKFCLSSRPETALIRQLGSFPSLRLQDLNYNDIESFVHGELKPCEDAFGDPRQFCMTVRDISHRAEGIFLWAVLVCKSLVSGYESKDDANMLQQRLRAIPSGLEALFARMFSNIDREHREYLSICFFLLKWSKDNGRPVVSDISIPVITAFQSENPNQSLSEFMEDCRVVEHRVVAQAKGLLETHQSEISMLATRNKGFDKFEPDILCDAVSGKLGYHSVSDESDSAEIYKSACIVWVHRSAYDYVLGDHSEYARSWRNTLDEEMLLRRLLDAQSWLAHHFPGQHMDARYAPVAHIANVIKDCTDETRMAGFQALEKLHDTIEASYYGQGCIGHDRCCVTGSKLHRIFREAGPLRAFWMNLFARSETEYLITHFDAIRSSVYAELFCSGLICEFWYWYSPILSEDKFSIPAITLSFDHLFHQGPMGQIVVAARPSGLVGYNKIPLCLSWKGRRRPRERRIVSDVSFALSRVRDCKLCSDYSGTGDPDTDYSRGVLDIIQRLFELSDLWKIYCGQPLDALGTTRCEPFQIHVSAEVYAWGYYGNSGPPGTNSPCSPTPAWRFVCFCQNEDRARQWSSGEYVPVMACFDVRAPKSKHLMNQYGKVYCDQNHIKISFTGTSEDEALCLETILEEVWVDADGQFEGGWQQLYMLACLKKYFGALWEDEIDDVHGL